MRIAILSHPKLPTPATGYGGAERVAHLTASEFSRMGHEVTMFVAAGSAPGQPYRSKPYEGPRDAFWEGAVPRDWSFLSGFDVVHNHPFGTQTWGWFLLERMLRANPALVTTLHSGLPYWSRPHHAVLGRWRRRRLSFIVLNRQELEYAGRHGLRGVHFVPIPVVDGTFRGTKEDYLLFFGRLSREKGLPWALEVAERTGVRLVIAGPGDDRALKELRPRLSKTIEYRGTVTDEEKDRLFAGARAFLFPTQWKEGMPAVVAEAAIRGTPVITTAFSAVDLLVKDGETGFVCKTPDEMVAAISRIDGVRPRACRDFVAKTVSPEAVARRHLDVYRDVMAGAR